MVREIFDIGGGVSYQYEGVVPQLAPVFPQLTMLKLEPGSGYSV